MPKISTKQIEKKLLKLARDTRYEEGMRIIDTYLRHHELTDKLLLFRAFLLYHHAAKLMYGKGKTKSFKQKNFIQKKFESAISICKHLIRKQHSIDNQVYLNSRLYLAQIYAMLGKKKEAILFARKTYKINPSTLTAERLADVYYRLGETNNAIFWYETAVKKTRDFTKKLFTQTNLAIAHKQMGNIKEAEREALKAFKFLNKAGKGENKKLLFRTLYNSFPEIIKK